MAVDKAQGFDSCTSGGVLVAVRENQVAVVIDSEGGEVHGLPETDEQVYISG